VLVNSLRFVSTHNRQRSRCKDCGGASICEHNRQRSRKVIIKPPVASDGIAGG
jgi:hypothetical protein